MPKQLSRKTVSSWLVLTVTIPQLPAKPSDTIVFYGSARFSRGNANPAHISDVTELFSWRANAKSSCVEAMSNSSLKPSLTASALECTFFEQRD
jgi:hypothetical protein